MAIFLRRQLPHNLSVRILTNSKHLVTAYRNTKPSVPCSESPFGSSSTGGRGRADETEVCESVARFRVLSGTDLDYRVVCSRAEALGPTLHDLPAAAEYLPTRDRTLRDPGLEIAFRYVAPLPEGQRRRCSTSPPMAPDSEEGHVVARHDIGVTFNTGRHS